MNNKRAALSLLFSGTMMATLAVAAPVTAAEVETAGNNLSYPAKLLGSGAPALREECGENVDPTGPVCALFPEYHCQKTEAVWQADCDDTQTSAVVRADWGDNLIDGRLRAGKPIRIEMTLLEQSSSGDGYIVRKLTPELDDRLATYGTLTYPFEKLTAENRVFDPGATLKIEKCPDPTIDPECVSPVGTVIPQTAMAAEINSMGSLVYGYNWGTKGRKTAPAAGTYKITFATVAAEITAVDDGRPFDANHAYVIVTLVTSGGGGGGQGGGRP